MKTKTNKILLISVIFSLIGIVFLYVSYSQIGKLNRGNDALSVEISTLYTQAVKAESLKNIVSNAGNKGVSLDPYFVLSGDEVGFIKVIESLAGSVNLKYTTNSISTVPDEKLTALDKELLQLEINTEGSWQNTRRFIAILETLPLNLKFNSLSLNTEIDTSRPSKATINETISTTTPVSNVKKLWTANINIVVVKKK